MPSSATTLFKNAAIHWEKSLIKKIPSLMRGVYVLFESNSPAMNVVYIGISTGESAGIRSRIYKHSRSKERWTHFSFYEVWDNISETQIRELEGLFLHIYGKDEHANSLNVAKSYKPLKGIERAGLADWVVTGPNEAAARARKPRSRKRKVAD